MYQVIKNNHDLQEWLDLRSKQAKVLQARVSVFTELQDIISTLDRTYGEDRVIDADLGGYTIIIYGNEEEIQNHVRKVLEHHHLKANEFEYEDRYLVPEHFTEVMFRLYLCSSDYAVVIITMREIER